MNEELKLFPFQKEGVKFLVERKRALLADDPGLGKTIQLICAATQVGMELGSSGGTTFNILVLCPKVMKYTWQKEIKKWGCKSLFFKYVVANYDLILRPKYLSKLKSQQWDIIILDESHTCIRNPKAKRFKVFFKYLMPLANRVWLSTATVASRTGLDYYGVLKVLSPKISNWTWQEFQKQFCNEEYCAFSFYNKKYVGFKDTQLLKRLFEGLSLRRKKEKVMPELPPKIYSYIEVEVPKSLEDDNEDIMDMVAGVAKTGAVPVHYAEMLQRNALAKIPAALEWIENFPEDKSLVIFVWHKSVANALAEKIYDCMSITGDTSEFIKNRNISDFQAGNNRRLVCNMAAGGIGITLTAASSCLYIEFPHSVDHLIQSENRIHRIGSKDSKVHINYLVGKGTVDEQIFRTLQERMKRISEVEG